jgi:ribosomal protein S18 acetylase RimI-like enzyme
LIIRPAGLADVDAIARVHVQAWHESYGGLVPPAALDARTVEQRMAQWRHTLGDPERPTYVCLAENHGTICGFASGGKILWTGLSTDSEVSSLYLLEAVKRRGAGRALFGRLLAALAGRGFTSAGLWVLTANAPARRFYEAMGGRTGQTRMERKDEVVLDEIAYLWDDLAPAGRSGS